MLDTKAAWFRHLRWRIREWLLFGCPPHEFGPVHDTGLGLGQQCAKCRLFRWSETAEEASNRMEANFHQRMQLERRRYERRAS